MAQFVDGDRGQDLRVGGLALVERDHGPTVFDLLEVTDDAFAAMPRVAVCFG
jgi:hypothetical protein